MIALNPRLSGSGKVTAAYIIASVALVLWVLAVITRISNISAQRASRYGLPGLSARRMSGDGTWIEKIAG